MEQATDQTPTMPMKDWVLSKGWRYIGTCGCMENKSMYLNDEIPDWKVQITPLSTRLEMWEVLNSVDAKKRFMGGPQNYIAVYEHALRSKVKLKE